MRFAALFAAALSTTTLLAQQRPAITGIAFMRVYTDDVPAAEHFYGPTMGYDEKHNGEEMVFPINQHQWIEVCPRSRATVSPTWPPWVSPSATSTR